MQQQDNFNFFDQLGQKILKNSISFDSYHDNSVDQYGWYDCSGSTLNNLVLFELKCNNSSQDTFNTTIITKTDWDKLLTNTPDDVNLIYTIFTNNHTYHHNLKKIAEDESLFDIKPANNKSTSMGSDSYERVEEWVYIYRKPALAKGLLKIKNVGGKASGFDIDKELKERKGK
ncbi:hypothetical protein [Pedobacter agri]|uniref:hypothetical protein n=1 Tax=Pedobacter agri TaxID=454586 RepID=UPI0029309D12|nr:hypothetical protein [Pedobacter agri]